MELQFLPDPVHQSVEPVAGGLWRARVAVHARVFSHDILYGFDGGAYRHC